MQLLARIGDAQIPSSLQTEYQIRKPFDLNKIQTGSEINKQIEILF